MIHIDRVNLIEIPQRFLNRLWLTIMTILLYYSRKNLGPRFEHRCAALRLLLHYSKYRLNPDQTQGLTTNFRQKFPNMLLNCNPQFPGKDYKKINTSLAEFSACLVIVQVVVGLIHNFKRRLGLVRRTPSIIKKIGYLN